MQGVRYSFGDLALNTKDVSQLAIVRISPEVGIGLRVNQLHIDPDLFGRFLHATLKNVGYPKLLRDLAQIPRFALILLGRSARNYFQIRDASQPRQDLVLNAVREIGVIWIAAEIFKRQNRDAGCYRTAD